MANQCWELSGPVAGVPVGTQVPTAFQPFRTRDLAHIDGQGRLRLLGRLDDEPINGSRPRHTLDAIGPVLGRRSAQVRHPAPDAVIVHLAGPPGPGDAAAIQRRAAELLQIRADRIALHH